MVDLSNAITLIKHFEGCELTAYADGKNMAIGYGHNSVSIKEGETITQAQADAFLVQDTQLVLAELEDLLSSAPPFSESLLNALVDLVYNVGIGHFKNSSLFTKLSQKNPRTPNELLDTGFLCNSSGIVLKGLVKRRMAEFILWTEGILWLPVV